MANIKFSEFQKATQSKDTDELAILQDGVNKMIPTPILESKIINKTVSRVIDQGGASLNIINPIGVVPTYADLALITPTPELNDAYQVEADGLVYVYTETGFQSDGEGFIVQPEPNGVVVEGNTQAVSGGKVFNALPKRGDNLFDGNYINASVLTDNTYQSSDTALSALIRVEPLTTYYVKKDNGNRMRIIELSEFPNITDAPSSQYSLGYTTAGADAKKMIFTTKENCKYVLLCVSTTTIDVKTQVTKTDLPFFIGYDIDVILSRNSINDIGNKIPPELIKNTAVFENIWDRLFYKASVLSDYSYIEDVASRSIIIPVEENTKYIFSKEGGNRDRCLFLSDFPIIGASPSNMNVINHMSDINNKEIITPDGCKYIMWGVSNNNTEPVIYIKKEYNLLVSNKKVFKPKVKHIYDLYKSPDYPSSNFLNTANQSIVIDIFDSLISTNPQYITKVNIGKSVNGIDMWKYTINANLTSQSSNVKFLKKKILIIGCLHGYEEMSAYAQALFFKDLIERRNDVNNYLLYNFEYEIIPMGNPDGFNLHQRENANGIDLNRDFIAQSQIETKNIVNAIKDINYDYYIDFHNIANPPSLFYILNNENATLAYNVFYDIRDYWINKYSLPSDTNIGNITYINIDGTSGKFMLNKGVPTVTLESPWKQPFDVEKYGVQTTETAVELLGNTLKSVFLSIV